MIIVERNVPGVLTLSFKYFEEYVNRVRSLGARFNSDLKVWELPENLLNNLEIEFDGELYFKTPRWEITGEEPPDYSELYSFSTNANINELNFKLKPFKYQEFGIKFLIDRLENEGMGFICDAVGLGKTIQAIGAMKYFLDSDLVKDIVIVCKKSLKTQWAEEINKFVDIGADIYVVEEAKTKRLKTYDKVKANPGKTITIVNYHALLKDSKILKADMVVYDEVHIAKKHDGQINKACKQITANASYCLFMTGTPLMARPEDLYGIVSIKDKKYFGGSHKKFEERYLVKSYGRYIQTVGCRNLNELRDKVQKLILRRTANEVAIDLPEVVELTHKLSMDPQQAEASRMVGERLDEVTDKLDYLSKISKKSDEDKQEIEKLEGQVKGFIAMQQIVANNPRLFHFSKSKAIKYGYESVTPSANYLSSKYIKLLDIMEELKEEGQKAIIFTKYETVAKHIADFLNGQKIRSVCYYGMLNQEDRDNVVNDFKFNEQVSAFVATDAAAEGLNLQIAGTVIHFDLPFNQAIYDQRNGRARRAGSKHSTVMSYNLITEGTIDETIYNKIQETKTGFDAFVSVDKAQSKLLSQLSN